MTMKKQTDLEYSQTHQSDVVIGQDAHQLRAQQNRAKVIRQENAQFSVNGIEVKISGNQLIGRNTQRRFLAFQNQSAVDVYISFGRPASISSNSFVLAAGGYFSFESGLVPNNEVYAISNSNVILTVLEGSA